MSCCCLGGATASSSASVPNAASSFYQTPAGLVVLTWSRAVAGRTLRVDVHLYDGLISFSLGLSPWLFWRLKGSKTAVLHNRSTRLVQLNWNLSSARFSSASPEPASGFSLSLFVDWETVLFLGDFSPEEGGAVDPRSIPILRQDHVFVRRRFSTEVTFSGQRRELAVDLGSCSDEARLVVRVDGERVFQVKKLRWKFRGSEKVVVAGVNVQISWDVHNWFFDQPVPGAGADYSDLRQALFMFRFENNNTNDDGDGDSGVYASGNGGYVVDLCDTKQAVPPQSLPWAEKKMMGLNRMRKRSLVQANSSSSSSSLSLASNNSVMDWASPEETELQSVPGFTLQVYGRRKI